MAAIGLLSRFLQGSHLRIPLQRANLILQQPSKGTLVPVLCRSMSEDGLRKFKVQVTGWADRRFFKMLRWSIYATGVPSVIIITYVNVFIGNAVMTETPEGYTPHYWEYHKHPITRFIARYMGTSPQQEYEKLLDYADLEMDKKQLRRQEQDVRRMMRQHGDGHWYYDPTMSPSVYGDKE